MHRIARCALAALFAAVLGVAAEPASPSYAEPAISPDRSEIVFVSGGDIWTVPAGGGEARLVISHPATESRPLYSPDGKRLAFVSNRTGSGDIYVLTFATGDVKRLTFDDAAEQLDAWSRDGRWIYLSSPGHDIAAMNDVLRVSAEGGTPLEVTADRYVNEYWSAPSPDGSSLAFTARGITSWQWWRRGRSHIDECEIWVRRDGEPARYERITEDGGARDAWPMWSADGRSLFYVSDRAGALNIWTRPLAGKPRQLTPFKTGRVLWPNISYDGRTIVFERDFRIWKLDTRNNEAGLVPIALRGAPAGPAVEHLRMTDRFQELALSPDGKKIAFRAHGEIFAASAKDGGNALRVTARPGLESQIAWAPDSRRLVYVSKGEDAAHLFLYEFASAKTTQLTNAPGSDGSAAYAPDGKSIAFIRDGRELRVIDPATKEERLLAKAYMEKAPFNSEHPFAWSPDGKWIAFIATSGKLFANVNIVSAAGGEVRPVSFLANTNSDSVSWSPDGKYLLFATNQRTESGQVARVDLVPRTPKFREDQFRDLFKEETPRAAQAVKPAPAAPEEAKKPDSKPVEIVFEGIRRRAALLPLGVDVQYQTISPDGKTLLLVAAAAGQQNIYVYPLDELAKEPAVARQITSTPGGKGWPQFTPDSKEVFFLEQGRVQSVNIESRQVKPVAVTAEMDIDFGREKLEVFDQAWTYLRDFFFDPGFNGVDWNAVRKEYAPRIAGARTPDEMRRAISLMVGELNASHSGISGSGGSQPAAGRLGLRFNRAEYEKSGRLLIGEVIPLSPATIAGQIHPGDTLRSIDGIEITAATNLDELLAYKIGKRVALGIVPANAPEPREVIVQPVSMSTEKGLLYRKWVEDNRAYVAKASNGRLGYVHMFDMGTGSLAQLHLDLDTENHSRAGVVIDVRNNNGGFVNAYALDVLARKPYLTMTVRDLPSAPARTVLGQRALEAPTILITNQHSLSDAEDFTEGYRTLKLGKVVGEPTAGWIVYTWGVSLLDGSALRLPRTKVMGSDGALMEMNPRQVDVAVSRALGEPGDTQLDTAVRELLKQIDAKK